MLGPENFFARATEADSRAKAAPTSDLRAKFVAMAAEWRELAEHIRRRDPPDLSLADPDPARINRSDIDVHLGRQLRERRIWLRRTQQDLGVAIGVRAKQIRKYEFGAGQIPALQLWFLTKALDVPMSYFYEGLKE
ncbi:MAG: helix-turn-helix transcriptional regulator [Mycobacterium sp.]|uniref:helix-turn-helix domain-containing protein n=1 Tax=Mycobacterium sp. TaxID=1785 RepID=UPI001ECF1A10|nr:helix-turn-helix transcriptional regulator [Mycobacterium sp.]MBV8787191.1 helix-turn-helix transcriptional regulator [Mycobacterium sp.]